MWWVRFGSDIIHAPVSDELRLPSTSLSVQLNAASSFEFDIYPEHPHFAMICEPMRPGEFVTVERDGSQAFRGRILRIVEGIYGQRTVTCESQLAFLNDTVLPPFDFSGKPRDFLSWVVDRHNEQVDSSRKFAVGRVEVSGGSIARSSESPVKALDAILSRTAESSVGGYIVEGFDGERPLIEWVDDPGGATSQEVALGVSILSLTHMRDGGELYTACYPTGADDGNGPLTIESLPDQTFADGGVRFEKRGRFLSRPDLVAEYGWICRTDEHDSAETVSGLLEGAEAFLRRAGVPETFEVQAVDLANAGLARDALSVGSWARVRSDPHGIDQKALITGISGVDINDPSSGTVTFGGFVRNASSGGFSPSRATPAKATSPIVMGIRPSHGTVFYGGSGYTVLWADIYSGASPCDVGPYGIVTDGGREVGTLRWYRGPDENPEELTEVFMVYASEITGSEVFLARVERDGEVLAQASVTLTNVALTVDSATVEYGWGGDDCRPQVWEPTVPDSGEGDYLYTKTTNTYADGRTIESISVSNPGRDGVSPYQISICGRVVYNRLEVIDFSGTPPTYWPVLYKGETKLRSVPDGTQIVWLKNGSVVEEWRRPAGCDLEHECSVQLEFSEVLYGAVELEVRLESSE